MAQFAHSARAQLTYTCMTRVTIIWAHQLNSSICSLSQGTANLGLVLRLGIAGAKLIYYYGEVDGERSNFIGTIEKYF